jgi:serine/threonine protein kinase
MEPLPGYRLTQILGRGGFGEVWEGVAADGAKLAFKFLPCRFRPARSSANEVRQLLSLRELRHPHLIEVKSVVASPNYTILAMERADGSLLDLLHAYQEVANTHVPPDHLCELIYQAAVALDFLASQRTPGATNGFTGLQHCDVKPSNMLLVGEDLKVSDFGLCAPQFWGSRRGHAFGTPGYAPPELAAGRVTERTDQFSLAVTYCELRMGQIPFPGEGFRRTADRPADLSEISDRERPTLARALDRDWLNRWPTCVDFASRLRDVVRKGGMAPHKFNRSGVFCRPALV